MGPWGGNLHTVTPPPGAIQPYGVLKITDIYNRSTSPSTIEFLHELHVSRITRIARIARIVRIGLIFTRSLSRIHIFLCHCATLYSDYEVLLTSARFVSERVNPVRPNRIWILWYD